MIFTKAVLVGPDGLQVERRVKEKHFAITATRNGVSFTASPIFSMNSELQQFARALGDSWKDHMALHETGQPANPEEERERARTESVSSGKDNEPEGGTPSVEEGAEPVQPPAESGS